jgi:hypothetical protein
MGHAGFAYGIQYLTRREMLERSDTTFDIARDGFLFLSKIHHVIGHQIT